MRRMQLFEIEDQSWCPGVIRDAGTAYLSAIVERTGMLDPFMPIVQQALEKAKTDTVVDLCTGAGLAARKMSTELGVKVLATDLYPNVDLLEKEASSAALMSVEKSAVDARNVPSNLRGLRTMYNAFHHFAPDDARAILKDAHDASQPIALFEMVDRRPANWIGAPFIPLMVLGFVPTLRPFRLAWVPLTYLLPLIPLMVWWDGIVSCLRVYQPPELKELVAGLDDFDWDIGRVPIPGAPIQGTWLVGTPKTGDVE